MSNLTHALEYAGRGLAVWPVHAGDKRPIAELAPHGRLDATCDPDVIETWWRWRPEPSIGLVIPAGRTVVDLDPHNGCRWTPGDFPATLTVVTGGGGWHLWYACSRDVALRHRLDDPRWQGLDVLTAGDGVIAPPSRHRSGRRYVWRDAPIVGLPAVITDNFTTPTYAPNGNNGHVTASDAYVRAAVTNVLAELAAVAGPSNHHWPLVRACKRLRELGVALEAVEDALLERVPGHDPREARRTLTSIWR